MGTSTDAILFYGYVWDEQTDGPIFRVPEGYDPEDCDWEYAILEFKGFDMRSPYDDMPAGLSWDQQRAWSDAHRAELNAYYAARREVIEGARRGCKIDSHCSGDYPIPLVCVEDSMTTAWRGHTKRIESIEVGADWDERLDAFVELMGIDVSGMERGWWLVSWWG